MTKPEAKLWSAFWSDQSDINRNAIFEHYWPYICKVVRDFMTQMRRPDFYDDALSYVSLRVLKRTIPRYDPTKCSSFKSHLNRRITYAIIDAIRGNAPDRQRRHCRRACGITRERLSNALGRRATDREVAEALGIQEGEIVQAIYDHECQLNVEKVVLDPPHESTADFLGAMSDMDREIVDQMYAYGYTQTEVARKLGTSPRTVSRRLARLAAKLDKKRPQVRSVDRDSS